MASSEKPEADVVVHDSDSEEEEAPRKDEKSDEEGFSGEEEGEDRQEDGQRMTAFNMKEEMEEGHFDAQGSFVWDKKGDEVRDHWADNIGSMKIAKVKMAGELPEIEELDERSLTVKYERMLNFMQPPESVNQAIRRLAGSQSGLSTMERLKLKKAGKLEPKQDLDVLTELANEILLRAGNTNVYEMSYFDVLRRIDTGKELSPDSDDDKKDDFKRKLFTPVPDATLDMYADDFEAKEKEKLEEPDAKKRKVDDQAAGSSSQVPDTDDEKKSGARKRIKSIRKWLMTPAEIDEVQRMTNLKKKCTAEQWKEVEKQYELLKATKAAASGKEPAEEDDSTTDDEDSSAPAADDKDASGNGKPPSPDLADEEEEEELSLALTDDKESVDDDKEPSESAKDDNAASVSLETDEMSSVPAEEKKETSEAADDKEEPSEAADDNKEAADDKKEAADDKKESSEAADDNKESEAAADDKEASAPAAESSAAADDKTATASTPPAVADEKKSPFKPERKLLRSAKKASMSITDENKPSGSSKDEGGAWPMATRGRKRLALSAEDAKKTPPAAKGKKKSPAAGKGKKKSSMGSK